MTDAKTSTALRRGVAALLATQLDDGSFPFQVIERNGNSSDCHPLFSTVNVLLSMGDHLPPVVVEKAMRFVLSCQQADGMWSFDPSLEIPADADDTACAIACIARFKPDACAPADAGLLRSYWRHDGGPFRTWHSDDLVWTGRDRDDMVVNANVIFALKALGAPATAEEIASVMLLASASTGRTRYYVSPATVAYAVVRAGISLDCLPVSTRMPSLTEEDPLALAQWICASGASDSKSIRAVLEAQNLDGTWPAAPWCTDNVRDWGSSALTTAFCLEALMRGAG